MNLAVIGSGGREHAICYKLKMLSLARSFNGLMILFCERCKVAPLSLPAIILI